MKNDTYGYLAAAFAFLIFIYSHIASHSIVQTLQKNTIDHYLSATVSASATASATTISSNDDTNLEIRKWGCNLIEAPFIFIHIGKAGGGSVRSQLALAAVNITKKEWHDKDGSFYPIYLGDYNDNDNIDDDDNNEKHAKATFSSSGHLNHRAWIQQTFEGTQQCQATTPMGLVGCLEMTDIVAKRYHDFCDREKDDVCYEVYAGHNKLGSEMHWLPFSQLETWWSAVNSITNSNITSESSLSNFLEDVYERKNPSSSFRRSHVKNVRLYNKYFYEYIQAASLDLDDLSQQIISPRERISNRYSILYQHVPVLRATILREPFSWLVSKFFWNRLNRETTDEYARTIPAKDCLNSNDIEWAHGYAIEYMEYLCGEDCAIANQLGLITIDEMEKQAAANLRKSIAVVGLGDDSDGFYDMINKRVQYLNIRKTTKKEERHVSKSSELRDICNAGYKNKTLQDKMIRNSPAIAAMVRLYEIGVEVNQFHRNELDSCSGGR